MDILAREQSTLNRFHLLPSFEAQICLRFNLTLKHTTTCLNTPRTIACNYLGAKGTSSSIEAKNFPLKQGMAQCVNDCRTDHSRKMFALLNKIKISKAMRGDRGTKRAKNREN